MKTLKGRALKLVLILACLLACTCSALAQGWSNGYALRRTITIDHTLVPNTDQTNFPVLVSGTFSDLATTSNGGYVTSPSGYDILFTSDANGATKLPFEQESFNAATGAIIYWVQVPTVSHTVDTVFYVFYGNSSITTDQSNKTGVWDANYRAVWHLPNGSTLNTTDSTSNANNGTANGNVTASGGLIDGAAKFGGNTSDYIRVPSSSSFKPTTALTLEAWVDASSIGSWGNVLSLDYHANGSWSAPYSSYSVYFLNTASNIAFNLTTSGTANTVTSASTLPLNQWVHVVATYGSGAQKLFINGIQNGAANSVSGAIDYGTSQDLAIGETSPYYLCCAWNGLLDEVRISSIDRSADWIAAEYNNQSSPSTFAIVGSAMQAPTKPMIARLTPTNASQGDNVTVQGANFGAAQGSSTVSLNGTSLAPQTWGDTAIGNTVPSGASSGTFSVTVNGQTAVSPTFTVKAIPSGWNDADIGNVGIAGSSTYANEIFTVKGAGSQIWGSADSFHFVYQPLSGDGTIIARVLSVGSNLAAGVMIRESLSVGATNAIAGYYTPGTDYYMNVRTSTWGSTSSVGSATATLPYWIKVVRSGSAFSGYASPDGVNWVQIGTNQTISMAQNVYVGLAVGSSNSTLGTATFDNVSVTPVANPGPVITGESATTGSIGSQVVISGAGFGNSQGSSLVFLNDAPVTVNSWSSTSITITIPSGATSGLLLVSVGPSMDDSNAVEFTVTTQPLPATWLDQDVGVVGTAGSATYANGTFTVKGAGSQIWGSADSFHFVYEPLSGDGTIVARVVTVGPNLAAGVMIRETLSAGSTNAIAGYYTPGTDYYMNVRTTTSGSTSSNGSASATLPYWVKVVRSGSTFTGYAAPDGVNWIQIGTTQTINMAQNVYIGLVVGSTNSTLGTATFDNVSVSSAANPAPVITSVSATTGSVGSQVVIYGQNFGSSQGNSLVLLNGSATTINAWSATSITITIPSGATSGYLVVSVAPSMDNSNPVEFAVTSNPLPLGWLDQDVGVVGIAGSATYSNGTFTIKGSGSDIWGNGDQFHFVYQPLSGDGTIVARVVSLQGGGNDKAGVMIRETLNSGSTEVDTTQFGTTSIQLLYRSSTGGSTNYASANDSLPYWVKLVRSGNSFSGYMALDGQNWVQVGTTQTITMAQNVYIGLAVSSTTNSSLLTATFDNVSVSSTTNPAPVITSVSATTGSIGSQVVITGQNFGVSQGNSLVLLNGSATTINAWSATSITITIPSGATSGYLVVSVAPSMNDSNPLEFVVTSNPLPPGWVDQDIGAVGIVGSATYSNGTFTVKGSGSDIWGNGDQFHFVYQPLSGDGTIVARVVSLQGGGNDKAGVMIRETLSPGATEADTTQFTATSLQLLYRTTTSGGTSYASASDSLPYWVKLVRSGSSFSGYMAPDGQNWVQVGTTQTITMAQTVYIGLAVSSTTNSSLLTATFDNVSVSSFNGAGGGLWGTVSNAVGGSAITGAQVRISQWNTTKATTLSDVNGRFAIGNLPEGAYDVTVSASGFGTSVTTGVVIVPYSDTTLNVNLTTPGTISGKVTQSDGVTAISGAAVQALVGASFVASATTDANGNFTLPGLNASGYQVQASADGYVPSTQSASVSAGSTTTLNFSLQGPGSSSGAVNYVYDALGRLVGVISPSGDAARYNYDAVGNLLSISRYNSSQLSIITFSPVSGPPGTAVTISGTGFSTTAGQNSVQFNGVAAVVQSASATQLVVTVPSSATTGAISVTTAAGTVTSNSSFTVTSH